MAGQLFKTKTIQKSSGFRQLVMDLSLQEKSTLLILVIATGVRVHPTIIMKATIIR